MFKEIPSELPIKTNCSLFCSENPVSLKNEKTTGQNGSSCIVEKGDTEK